MKRLLILALALFLLALPLAGCGYSQEELDDAYDDGSHAGYLVGYDIGYEQGENAGYQQGFASGKAEGYLEGLQDCPSQGDGPFVGSINSEVYHYPWCICAQSILPENELWFISPEEAQAAGYRPCEVCNPP